MGNKINNIGRTEHRGVFDEQIYKFFENDIESCLAVSKIKQEFPQDLNFPGGTNFTAALTILSVIEMMASYYHGIESNKNILKPASSTQVGEFLIKYFSKYDTKFMFQKFGENFYKVFRHGLSHQFSPKRAGVDMDFKSDKIITYPSINIPHLNVPALFHLTKLAFRDYDEDLKNGIGIENFIKHFDAINKIDDLDMNELKVYL